MGARRPGRLRALPSLPVGAADSWQGAGCSTSRAARASARRCSPTRGGGRSASTSTQDDRAQRGQLRRRRTSSSRSRRRRPRPLRRCVVRRGRGVRDDRACRRSGRGPARGGPGARARRPADHLDARARDYSDATGFVNPYHERELTLEEFAALLTAHFGNVALFAQRAVTGSRIDAFEPTAGAPISAPARALGRRMGRPGPRIPLLPRRRRLGRPAARWARRVELVGLRLRLVDQAREQEIAVREEREAVLLAERDRARRGTARALARPPTSSAHARAQRGRRRGPAESGINLVADTRGGRAAFGRGAVVSGAVRWGAHGLAFRGSRRSEAPRGRNTQAPRANYDRRYGRAARAASSCRRSAPRPSAPRVDDRVRASA